MKYYVGIDLGGTNTKVGICDENGQLLTQKRMPTEEPLGPEPWTLRVQDAVSEVIKQAQIEKPDVKCVGLGTPGPLSRKKGQVFKMFNLPHFANFKVCDAVKDVTGFPAFLDNDGNCATFAEWWVGAGKGTQHMILLTLGTGIGGGIVTHGQLIHGSKDMGTEIGHVTIDAKGVRCSCGNIGCVETFSSASAVARRTKEALDRGEKSSLENEKEITCYKVHQAALNGDALCNRIISEAGFYLGAYLTGMINIFDPELVILTGGMIGLGDMLLDPVRDVLQDRLFPEIREDFDIRYTALNDDAGIIGAAGCGKIAYETSQ